MNPLSEMCANYKDTFCKMHNKWVAPYLTLNGMSSVAAFTFHFVFVVLYLALCAAPALYVGLLYISVPGAEQGLPQKLADQNMWSVPTTIALSVCGLFCVGLLLEAAEYYNAIANERRWRS